MCQIIQRLLFSEGNVLNGLESNEAPVRKQAMRLPGGPKSDKYKYHLITSQHTSELLSAQHTQILLKIFLLPVFLARDTLPFCKGYRSPVRPWLEAKTLPFSRREQNSFKVSPVDECIKLNSPHDLSFDT